MIGKLVRGEARQSAHIFELIEGARGFPEYLVGETEIRTAGYRHPLRQVSRKNWAWSRPPCRSGDRHGGDLPRSAHFRNAAVYAARMADLYTRSPADKLIVAQGLGDSMFPTMQTTIWFDRHHQSIPQMSDQVWAVSCGWAASSACAHQ
jgi:hypothetical protein